MRERERDSQCKTMCRNWRGCATIWYGGDEMQKWLLNGSSLNALIGGKFRHKDAGSLKKERRQKWIPRGTKWDREGKLELYK